MPVAEVQRLPLPFPFFEQFGLYRVVVDGDEEVATSGRLRPGVEALDAPVEVDRAHAQTARRQRTGDLAGEHPVEIELLAPARAHRAGGGQRMADANGNQFIAYPDGSIERIS
mgnify:CR=1 FL=1